MTEQDGIFATVRDEETGEEATITASAFIDTITGRIGGKRLKEIAEESFSVIEAYGGGLALIDVHPNDDGLFTSDVIPLLEGFITEAGLRPGRYFVDYEPKAGSTFTDQELSRLDQSGDDGILLATHPGQLVGAALSPLQVSITPEGGSWGLPEDKPEPCEINAYLIQNMEQVGAFVTLYDLMGGITSNAAVRVAIERGVIPGGANIGDDDEIGFLPGIDNLSKRKPTQGTVKPKKQIDPNSKLANSITKIGFGKTAHLDVSGRGERKESVLTAVTLEYEGEGISLSKPMTQFDREVHNAVTTLWKAGNQSFTTWQVWSVLTGSTTGKPSREMISHIEKSIDKQRFTRAIVDFSAEARGRQLSLDGEPVKVYKIDSYMLNADKHRIETANGRLAEGYTVNKPPVLYQHSAIFGQLITYPSRLLETGEAGQNTVENIVIKKYLLRRIGGAKGKSKTSPRIKYSSVYDKVGIAEPDKKQRKRINDYVIACLELWKAAGHIKGFTEYKEGRQRAGVDLIV